MLSPQLKPNNKHFKHFPPQFKNVSTIPITTSSKTMFQDPKPTPTSGESDPLRLHARLIKSTSTDRSLYNNLITFYSKSPSTLPEALRVFHRLPAPPNVVSWTAIISAYSDHPSTAFRLFLSMLRRPTLPNQRTFASLLKTCAASPAFFSFGFQLHSLSLKLNLSHLPFSGSALVTLYSKSSLPLEALKAFDEIPQKDEVCYAAAIVGLAQNHRPADALSLFASMRFSSVGSTMYSVSGALRAAAEVAALEQSWVIHAHAVVSGLESNLVVGTTLVDAYGKSGVISDARKVFDGLSMGANVVVWNVMMAAYAQQGDEESTIDLFEKMQERGLVPDELTFLAVLTACSNSGLVTEAERWLGLMESCYSVAPGLEHYTCLLGAMARVGRVEDAEKLTLTMPFEPDAAVWRTVLSGCVVYGKVEMGRKVGERLLELDPQDDSAYVMLANIYSAAGRRDEMAEMWTVMRDRGVKKEGGRSWIEVRGEVHVFMAGDRRHERAVEIYEKLMELMKGVGRLGYEEPEEGLWYHSEKLAVAFGVVSGAAPKGKALRVVKNLRICGDCHEFFKYVSRLLEREIVVRDVNRYHRFENGNCSCRDFW